MADVANLKPVSAMPEDPYAADMVEALLDLLADVRSGKVVGLAFAVVFDDGLSKSGWESQPGLPTLAVNGAVAQLHYDMSTAFRVVEADETPG